MNTKAVIWIVVLVLAAVAVPSLALTYWLGYRHGRATVHTQAAEAPLVAGLSREETLRMLPGKTWYRHWEKKDRTRPTTFSLDRDGRIFVDGTTDKFGLELRWVLNDGGHIFIPIDDYTLSGFFISSGRQKGMFADRPQ